MTHPSETPSIDLIAALHQTAPDEFETVYLPERLGNAANIAYGGFALAAAIRAACLTVSDSYRLYSALGNYLGPALTDSALSARVRRIRDTKTFATRLVEIAQVQNGKSRSVMSMLADFHAPEKASLLVYSAPTLRPVGSWRDCPTDDEVYTALTAQGVPRALIAAHRTSFGLVRRFAHRRSVRDACMAQNMFGFAKLPTTHDELPLTERTSEDWNRARVPLPTHADSVAAMAFMADGAVSFVPLSHSGLSLMDAGACSSLDFALRFFVNEPRYDEWHLRELRTHAGGAGRTYSESRFWDESGTLVCSMTQQSILRPKPAAEGKSKI